MNKFTKTKKVAVSVLLALALMLTMAITVFAESADSGAESFAALLDNPQFYGFLAIVAGFIAVTGGGVALYFARNYQKKVQANKDADGTTKLYEDLDDTMWEKGPETVFIQTMEPPAAVLTDLKPVEKMYGLDGFVITEQPIDPSQALKMGADPLLIDLTIQLSLRQYLRKCRILLLRNLMLYPMLTLNPSREQRHPRVLLLHILLTTLLTMLRTPTFLQRLQCSARAFLQ